MRKILSFLIGCFLIISCSITFAANPPKKWTFLIYINGNNTLDRFGAYNIKQMEKIGSNDQINIVVQWASYSRMTAVRLLAEKSNDPSRVTSPILQDLGLVDMGDFRTLEDFIKWGVQNYPAEHYFVDVWNHGSGWNKKTNTKTDLLPNDISFDDISGHAISTKELGYVMASTAKLIGHKVDIYGSDACLMAMAEVANEMSDSVHYFLGSEYNEPGEGWPYDDLLREWTKLNDAQPDQVAKIVVDTYVASYEEGGSQPQSDVTFSAFDLTKMADLNKAIRDLSEDIQLLSPTSRIQVLLMPVQRFDWDRQYADLLDFNKNLLLVPGIHPKNVINLQLAASKFILENKTTLRFKRAQGLSFWLPQKYSNYAQKSKRYQGLKFNSETMWSTTLESLLTPSLTPGKIQQQIN